MPPDPPEPADLHAQFSPEHHLDWGDPIPTAAQIAAEFGPEATAESLELLCRLVTHQREVTRQLLDSIRPGDTTHELDHRVKSPSSLARKIWSAWHRNRTPLTDDLLRFTVVAKSPAQVVESARETVDRLQANGWRVESAHQSYVDGSRYNGIHAILRAREDVQVEVQFHSPESIRVKMATTRLYHVNRDPRESRKTRNEAATEAISLSAAMTQPAGLVGLTHLGGVPVEARSYGSSNRQTKQRQMRRPQNASASNRQSDDDKRIENGGMAK
ncbi:hypothetical protein EV643_12269 [Kribbella sp. VKM Ac-2527]|uniref:RelA/SpoT domain-containing protein n=1 Tax=Kribbella caucasensis TaxID=2512215 RepID=A0A4V3C6Z2_9ACTN|nr:hypothetical protein [Kribbella sp. VKM Ac-2527]TDO35658.1 hypothetical protein EV643_12269 [Kribbella sp. VKM Ac-2527]